MAIPDYQSIMRPLLEHASTGGERVFRDAVEALAGGIAHDLNNWTTTKKRR